MNDNIKTYRKKQTFKKIFPSSSWFRNLNIILFEKFHYKLKRYKNPFKIVILQLFDLLKRYQFHLISYFINTSTISSFTFPVVTYYFALTHLFPDPPWNGISPLQSPENKKGIISHNKDGLMGKG